MAVQTTPHHDLQINVSQANNVEPVPTINVHISSLNGRYLPYKTQEPIYQWWVKQPSALSGKPAAIPNHTYSSEWNENVPNQKAACQTCTTRPTAHGTSTPASKEYYYCGRQQKGSIYYPSVTAYQSHSDLTADHARVPNRFRRTYQDNGRTKAPESTDDAKPFCAKAPWAIPFAYGDKLKAELELLQQQGIIAPVTEPTNGAPQLWLLPKRTQTTSECAYTSPASTDT